MKKLVVAGAAGLLSLLAAQKASAQYYPPPTVPPGYYQPPVSPLVNLGLRGINPGINPGITYFGIVRPQQQAFNTLTQLQLGQQQLQAQSGLDPATGPATGHPTVFFNYSHYFNNWGGGSATGANAAPVNPRAAATAAVAVPGAIAPNVGFRPVR